MNDSPLFLGIDLGTSKVALALCEVHGSGVFHLTAAHHADLAGPPGTAEQDAGKILATAFRLIAETPGNYRARLAGIGLTGQMHGVVQHDEQGRACSPLVTWQDTRRNELKINGRIVPPGRGWGTLERWKRAGERVAPRCATIHGLLAAQICKRDRAPIDPTDLHAWGNITPPSSIPPSILPERVPHGALIGHSHGQPDLPDGIPVAAPLGDNQASVRGTLQDFKREAAFTIGTGCQLSIPVPIGHPAPQPQERWELRPFDSGHHLLVSAPPYGGWVWQWLARRVSHWSSELGGPTRSLKQTYALLEQIGKQADAASSLHFTPRLQGTSGDTPLTGVLSGFTPENGSLADIIQAVAYSIPTQALEALPGNCLKSRQRIWGSGTALRHSSLLRSASENTLGKPIQVSTFPEEAALGAARVARALA